ncbi:major facilitator superfamily domain-containing protein [Dactylonectria macrodidyma]|uniref:Major facilitator superfamily domain-containing protein n=1 Tax=Dactylonectria macrodidyma TaxID=307937 RepID=A0A9P9JNP8_9HYPO|nr:major facilitator superfamily domain-containing protein [Dactylonectria macrodidyma]
MSQVTIIELQEAPHESIRPARPFSSRSALATPPQSPPGSRVFEAVSPARLSPVATISITALLVCANVVQFISYFSTVAGGLAFSKDLGRGSGPGQSNWMAAAYPLTQGAFILITGRLGAVYGHKNLTLIGCSVFSIFSIVNAFCTGYESFIAARALTGIGGGLFMPNAVSTITITVPPGKSRNLLLGFFAASPPIGGVIGALLAGVFTQFYDWKWFFITVAIMQGVIIAGLAFLMPKETPVDKEGNIDYFGALLGLSSLLLFNIVWNQAPSQGWNSLYEIACLIVSVALFLTFLAWEKMWAKDPIMPLSIFRIPTLSALFFVVLLSYMAIGISVWYFVSWQQVLRSASVLQTGIGFIPFGVSSVFAVYLAAWLIPRVAAQWVLAVGVVMALGSNLLLATMPIKQTYWAQSFPAIIFAGFCPDFVYVAAQIIASNSVTRRQQGVASSLIGTLNLYGNSLGLGFAGTIETELVKDGSDTVLGFRAALYFGAAIAVIGLILDFAFVRVPKDEREGWDESTEAIDTRPEAFATAVDTRGV